MYDQSLKPIFTDGLLLRVLRKFIFVVFKNYKLSNIFNQLKNYKLKNSDKILSCLKILICVQNQRKTT